MVREPLKERLQAAAVDLTGHWLLPGMPRRGRPSWAGHRPLPCLLQPPIAPSLWKPEAGAACGVSVPRPSAGLESKDGTNPSSPSSQDSEKGKGGGGLKQARASPSLHRASPCPEESYFAPKTVLLGSCRQAWTHQCQLPLSWLSGFTSENKGNHIVGAGHIVGASSPPSF